MQNCSQAKSRRSQKLEARRSQTARRSQSQKPKARSQKPEAKASQKEKKKRPKKKQQMPKQIVIPNTFQYDVTVRLAVLLQQVCEHPSVVEWPVQYPMVSWFQSFQGGFQHTRHSNDRQS